MYSPQSSHMMETSPFNKLPKELISHIATSSDANTALALAKTSRQLRDACYDTLVFRDILIQSQLNHWRLDILDVSSISIRCQKDVDAWARYAVADQKAWCLAEKECPLETPERYLAWLPELFIVKHPFMFHQCWRRFLRDPTRMSARQMFCQAMAVLACREPMPQLHKSLAMQDDLYLRQGDSLVARLWRFCYAALNRRVGLMFQGGDGASPPHVALPRAQELSFTLVDTMELPLPFASRWYLWMKKSSERLAQPSSILEGTWCGYYVWTSRGSYIDPPMVNIKFERHTTNSEDSRRTISLLATECLDGHGPFKIDGSVILGEQMCIFQGHKTYLDGWRWYWELCLTPFGLIGAWGKGPSEEWLGSVWLWKVAS